MLSLLKILANLIVAAAVVASADEYVCYCLGFLSVLNMFCQIINQFNTLTLLMLISLFSYAPPHNGERETCVCAVWNVTQIHLSLYNRGVLFK